MMIFRVACVLTILSIISSAFEFAHLSKVSFLTRRDAIGKSLLIASPAILITQTTNKPANALDGGLAAKLSKRDASVLKNSIFNIPPSVQRYPDFMKGNWDVSMSFVGYLFPSTSISKDKIISNVNIPGFQKCSIASIADIGKEKVAYRMNIQNDGQEDRQLMLQTSINGHLGYNSIENVIYDPMSNPNRISIDFIPNRTRNANRIELFCNARESELVRNPNDESLSIFVNSEYIRQVTFGLSQEFGIARQVIGNYAHFWTWKQQSNGNELMGNVLTAVYLDPQDAMFFEEPSKPVAIYSHQIIAKRI